MAGPRPPLGGRRRAVLPRGGGWWDHPGRLGQLSARPRRAPRSHWGGSSSQPQVWPLNVPERSLRSRNLETLTDSLRRTDHNYRMNHMQLTEDLTQIFMRRAKNTPELPCGSDLRPGGRQTGLRVSPTHGRLRGVGSLGPCCLLPPTWPSCHTQRCQGTSPSVRLHQAKLRPEGPMIARAASLSG